MADKLTWMVLEVDLNCSSCRKAVKKILGKFPEIQDQVYEKQNNLVKITVAGSCPEKIRDRLCARGGKAIKSIRIIEPSKPTTKQPQETTGQPPSAVTTATSPSPSPAPAEPTKTLEPVVPSPSPAEPTKTLEPVTAVPPLGTVLGLPVPLPPEYYPFPFGSGCPQCLSITNGSVYDPWYKGYPKFLFTRLPPYHYNGDDFGEGNE